MEAVRGMVWIFSGIAQCDPIHCSPRGRMGILGAREVQGAHEEGGTGTPAKNAIAFYIINIHQMNLKILTGQASKHVNHSLNSLIQLVKINITLFQ